MISVAMRIWDQSDSLFLELVTELVPFKKTILLRKCLWKNIISLLFLFISVYFFQGFWGPSWIWIVIFDGRMTLGIEFCKSIWELKWNTVHDFLWQMRFLASQTEVKYFLRFFCLFVFFPSLYVFEWEYIARSSRVFVVTWLSLHLIQIMFEPAPRKTMENWHDLQVQLFTQDSWLMIEHLIVWINCTFKAVFADFFLISYQIGKTLNFYLRILFKIFQDLPVTGFH